MIRIYKKDDDQSIDVQEDYCDVKKYHHINELDKYLYKDIVGLIHQYLMVSEEQVRRNKALTMFQLRSKSNNRKWIYHRCRFCDEFTITNPKAYRLHGFPYVKKHFMTNEEPCLDCIKTFDNKMVLNWEFKKRCKSSQCVIL